MFLSCFYSDPNMSNKGTSQLTTWPEYANTAQQYIRFKANVTQHSIESHYAASRIHFWNDLVPVLKEDCGDGCRPCRDKPMTQPVLVG